MTWWAAQQQMALIQSLFLGTALVQYTQWLGALEAKVNLYFWVDVERLQVMI